MKNQQIAKIFTWRGFNFIIAPNTTKPEWKTQKYPLSSGEFAIRYEDSSQLLGIGFDAETDYVMADIDRTSPYHPLTNWPRFRRLIRTMDNIGLTGSVITSSSESGGIHVYFPLPRSVNTFNLAVAAKVAEIDAGFEVGNGKLEFFPNVKAYDTNHTRHRLPLQPNSGSIVLDQNGKPLDIAENEQHGVFYQQWTDAAAQQDMRLLERKMRQLRAKWDNPKNYYKYKYQTQSAAHKTIKAEEFERSLDKAIEIGWIRHDMTQQTIVTLMKKFAIFGKLAGQQLIDCIVAKAQTLPGYHQYCNHKHDLRKVATSWVHSNERTNKPHQGAYYTPYCSHPIRDGYAMPTPRAKGSPNNPSYQKSADNATQRIVTAVANLPQPPATYRTIEVLIAAIQSKTRELFGLAVGRDTLGKNKPLWHPRYADSTTLPETFSTEPETNQDNDSSDIELNAPYKNQNAETQTEQRFDYPDLSMLCSESSAVSQADPVTDLSSFISTQPNLLVDELVAEIQQDSISYTGHYNLLDNRVVTRAPGKFEVLGNALAKIAAVAALVVNMVATAGIIEPEPAIAVEPIVNPVSTPVAETNLPQDLPTHPLQVRPQARSEIDRSLEPTTRSAMRSHNAAFPDVTADVTSSGVDRQEQIAAASLLTQIPIEQTTAVNDRHSGRSQEPSSRLQPFRPIPKDNPRQCACPECELSTPPTELERWGMCRFCATKILFKRTI
jgi:hypothetical protein